MDITVVTWNMAGGNKRYQDDFLKNMKGFFNHVNDKNIPIDIICTQEVIADPRFWDKVNDKWTWPGEVFPGYHPGGLMEGVEKQFKQEGYGYNYVSHQIKPNTGEPNDYEAKVIWSRKKIDSYGHRTILKGTNPSIGISTWSRTVAYIEVNVGGKKVFVFNYHGPNVGCIKTKIKFAKTVEKYVKDITNGFSEHFIITGDFNLTAGVYDPFKQFTNHPILKTIEKSWVDWQVSDLTSTREEITIIPPITDHAKLFKCKYTI